MFINTTKQESNETDTFIVLKVEMQTSERDVDIVSNGRKMNWKEDYLFIASFRRTKGFTWAIILEHWSFPVNCIVCISVSTHVTVSRFGAVEIDCTKFVKIMIMHHFLKGIAL